MHLKTTIAAVALVTGCVSAWASAAEPSSDQLMQEMQALRAEVAELRAQQGESWMSERRAQEIKTLVHEVLADAETRASLLDSAVTAGWDGERFFLADEGGMFLFVPQFQFQMRYIYNDTEYEDEDDDVFDDTESGFQLRRVEFGAYGHAWDPSFKYDFRLSIVGHDYTRLLENGAANLGGLDVVSGDVILDRAIVSYEFDNGVWIEMQGVGHGAFGREERVDSQYQLAAERSAVNEWFGTDKVQGMLVGWKNEMFSVEVMLNDGYQGYVNDFHLDTVDYGISARAEWLAAGSREQFEDMSSWAGDEMGLLIGAGLHYEEIKDATMELLAPDSEGDLFLWTVDGSFEYQGASVFLSFSGMHPELEAGGTDLELDGTYGMVLQGAYNIDDKFEPFVRWEHIWRDDLDGAAPGAGGVIGALGVAGVNGYANLANLYGYEDDLDIITLGFNYYLTKHNSKFTFDVMFVTDRMFVSEPGLGLRSNSFDEDDDSQIAVRAQYQFAF